MSKIRHIWSFLYKCIQKSTCHMNLQPVMRLSFKQMGAWSWQYSTVNQSNFCNITVSKQSIHPFYETTNNCGVCICNIIPILSTEHIYDCTKSTWTWYCTDVMQQYYEIVAMQNTIWIAYQNAMIMPELQVDWNVLKQTSVGERHQSFHPRLTKHLLQWLCLALLCLARTVKRLSFNNSKHISLI